MVVFHNNWAKIMQEDMPFMMATTFHYLVWFFFMTLRTWTVFYFHDRLKLQRLAENQSKKRKQELDSSTISNNAEDRHLFNFNRWIDFHASSWPFLFWWWQTILPTHLWSFHVSRSASALLEGTRLWGFPSISFISFLSSSQIYFLTVKKSEIVPFESLTCCFPC